MAQFAVIGLGSFGATVAKQLSELGHEVIGIDANKRHVEDLSDYLSYAVIADASDEKVLQELNLVQCDAVLVAIGEDIEASILTVLNLKNIGVAKIWAKAKNKAHHTILSQLQVNKIIHPEEDMGVRVAQALNYPMVSRYMALDNQHFIIKVIIPALLDGSKLDTLLDNNAIKVLILQRNTQMFYDATPYTLLQQGDILILEGPLPELKKLSQHFDQ